MNRIRSGVPLLLLALATACSSGGVGTTTSLSAGSDATDPSVTTTVGRVDETAPTSTATTEPAAATTETTTGRPLAPDFTLELGDGGEYTLSEGERPVYLVFWAEW